MPPPWLLCCCGTPDRISTIAVPLGTRINRLLSSSRNYFCGVHAVHTLRLTAVTRPNTPGVLATVVWTAQPAGSVVAGHHLDIDRTNPGGPFTATASLAGTKTVHVYVVEIQSLVCTNGALAAPDTYDIDAAPHGHAELEATPNPGADWFRNALPWAWNGGNAGRSSRRRRVPRNQVANTVVSVQLFGQQRQITVRVRQVEAVLRIDRITFVGSIPVECDTLGDFEAVWEPGRAQPGAVINQALDQYNGVLCYRRNQPVRVSVELSVTTRPFPAEVLTLEGTANIGGTQLTWTANNVAVGPGDATVTVQDIDSDVALPDVVASYTNVVITWSVTGAGGARNLGQTTHTLHTTLGASLGGPNYWTLLDITGRAANAAAVPTDTPDRLVAALGAHLAGTTGTGNGHPRCRDGTRLSYWAQGRNTPFLMTTADLMRDNTGTGRCNAWQSLFIDALRLHGVASNVYNISTRPAGFGFNVLNIAFNGGGNPRNLGEPPLMYDATVDCVKQNGLPGQGTDDPQFLFTNHAMVLYGGSIYDPSYGTGPYPTLLAWERASLGGIGLGITQLVHAGQPLEMSTRCSPGFHIHRLGVGETLADVALAHNVVGGAAALHSHALNYALRLARPGGADTVQANDVVFVPRAISDILIVGPM